MIFLRRFLGLIFISVAYYSNANQIKPVVVLPKLAEHNGMFSNLFKKLGSQKPESPLYEENLPPKESNENVLFGLQKRISEAEAPSRSMDSEDKIFYNPLRLSPKSPNTFLTHMAAEVSQPHLHDLEEPIGEPLLRQKLNAIKENPTYALMGGAGGAVMGLGSGMLWNWGAEKLVPYLDKTQIHTDRFFNGVLSRIKQSPNLTPSTTTLKGSLSNWAMNKSAYYMKNFKELLNLTFSGMKHSTNPRGRLGVLCWEAGKFCLVGIGYGANKTETMKQKWNNFLEHLQWLSPSHYAPH